jgi:hypothetical protein
MASDHNSRDDADAGFSLGARESHQPGAAQGSMPSQVQSVNGRVKSARESRGNDPYNTSGSFDRTRNWARVGKR